MRYIEDRNRSIELPKSQRFIWRRLPHSRNLVESGATTFEWETLVMTGSLFMRLDRT